MVADTLTLRELWNRKAKDYFNRSRDKDGVPTTTFEAAYREVQADYGTPELDSFNVWWKGHWNKIMSAPQQVIWADGSYDDQKECVVCHTQCQHPVHTERYKETVSKVAAEKEHDE